MVTFNFWPKGHVMKNKFIVLQISENWKRVDNWKHVHNVDTL